MMGELQLFEAGAACPWMVYRIHEKLINHESIDPFGLYIWKIDGDMQSSIRLSEAAMELEELCIQHAA